MFKEPTTAITDFILFLLGYSFFLILIVFYFFSAESAGNNNFLFWSLFFIFNASGAFCGVITHGFNLKESMELFLLKTTLFLLGISLYFFIILTTSKIFFLLKFFPIIFLI